MQQENSFSSAMVRRFVWDTSSYYGEPAGRQRQVRLPHSIANNRDIGIAFVHDPFKTFEKQYVGMVYAICVVKFHHLN